MTTRRRLLVALGAGALIAPRALLAQQPAKIHHVGIMSIGTDPANTSRWSQFFDAMREFGYVEGRNLRITHAHGKGVPESLPGLVATMINAKVDVIVTTGRREIQALQRVTSTIPIVMTLSYDPVAEGFVKSLARPGGNITGLTFLVPGMPHKYVELLREIVPSAKKFAVVNMPPNPTPELAREFEEAARALGVTLLVAQPSNPGEFDGVLGRLKKDGVAGIIVPVDGGAVRYRSTLIPLAQAHRLPAIYGDIVFVNSGGLMSYTANFEDQFRRAATFVDKILRGANPANLPVEQPTKFELVINMKTAKALGLKMPPALLLRADRLIE